MKKILLILILNISLSEKIGQFSMGNFKILFEMNNSKVN
jgi:hypothetical protein